MKKINEIVFYTSNPAKIYEAEIAFFTLGIKVVAMPFEFVEIQSDSPEDVLIDKARQVRGKDEKKRAFLVDDSGFYLESYPGFPGVMSKFIYQTINYEGIFKLLLPDGDRRAFLKASVGLDIDGDLNIFEGKCDGYVSQSVMAETKKGFLFEPIFIPNGQVLTLAEMDSEERKRYSYRARALNKVADFLKE